MKIKHNSINYSVNTVDDLTVLTGEDGDIVVVSDIDRGGTFVYDSSKSAENNGGTVFNGWVRQYDGAVNVKWFGAKGDGATDDTTSIQNAINYSSINIEYLDISYGVYYVNKITYNDPTNLFSERGKTTYGILFLKDNTRITGNGTLKVGDNIINQSFTYSADINSGVYLNYEMPGTKGFQLFVSSNATNVLVSNLTIDLNGYNNKSQGVNAFDNSMQMSAFSLSGMTDGVLQGLTIKDAPGSQVISISNTCNNITIKDNILIDCGFLDGTNTDLPDHSSIYTEGTNTHICGNTLKQTYQYVLSGGGTPIEIHNSATVENNTIVKYASCGVISASIPNGNFLVKDNTYKDISFLGFDMYCSGNYNMNCKIENNNVSILKLDIQSSHVAYKYRKFINTIFFGNSPGDSNIEIIGNNVEMVGATLWLPEVDKYNTIIQSNLITELKVINNTFKGFHGAFITLDLQKGNSSLSLKNNNLYDCGISNGMTDYNAVVNYENLSLSNYGIQLYSIESKMNTFSNCKYSSYFSFNQVAGNLMVPKYINIHKDVHNIWLVPIQTSSATDILNSSNYNWNINYSVETLDFNNEEQLKIFENSNTNMSRTQFGSIELIGNYGNRRFHKIKNTIDWVCEMHGYGDTTPTLNEVSPFGKDYVGDKKLIINPVPTGNVGWVCTTSGAPGIWKPFGVINSDLGNLKNIEKNTLPTSDPAVAGQLWNNNGTVTVSAG